jgi:glycosyltransferase involved in cell wall biosynthesis
VKLLVSSSPWSLARWLPGVVGGLLDRGAELVVASPQGTDPLPLSARGRSNISLVELPFDGRGGPATDRQLFRALTDLVRFYRPELLDARWPRVRVTRRLLDSVGHPSSGEAAPRLAEARVPADLQAKAEEMLTSIEHRIPAEPKLMAAVRELGVDAVLLISRCSLGGVERDLIKVARELELPSVMLVWSWDNLSSKAVLHEHPDHLLVWNELQVDEAERLHGFPRERIYPLGAPSFDEFFAALDAVERPAPDGKVILYLGSSKNIARREPELVFPEWLAALRASSDPVVRGARVVVRPYPGGGAWRRWRPDSTAFTVERGKKLAPTELARALAAADAVVALNTSGELEAAIAGLPVVTFRAGSGAPGQEGSIHFEYLLEQNGGFVIDSRDLDEHVSKLGHVLRGGHDPDRQRAFVESFVRPRGLDKPVSPAVAQTILERAAK